MGISETGKELFTHACKMQILGRSSLTWAQLDSFPADRGDAARQEEHPRPLNISTLRAESILAEELLAMDLVQRSSLGSLVAFFTRPLALNSQHQTIKPNKSCTQNMFVPISVIFQQDQRDSCVKTSPGKKDIIFQEELACHATSQSSLPCVRYFIN